MSDIAGLLGLVVVDGRFYPHEDASVPDGWAVSGDGWSRDTVYVRKQGTVTAVSRELLEDSGGYRRATWAERERAAVEAHRLRRRIPAATGERVWAVRRRLARLLDPEG